MGDVLDALRRRWLVALLVALPLWGGVALYVASLPDTYDGEAVVAFSPRPDADVSADILRVVVPKYVAYLTARATTRDVAVDLGEDPAELGDAVDASVATDTANLTVTVRLPDAERAAAAANAFAQEAVTFSEDDLQLIGRVVAPALPPVDPASPPRTLMLAGGAVLGLLLALTAAVAIDRSSPRITDALGLALASGHGVVGRVPSSRSFRDTALDALNDPVVGTAVRAMRTQLEQQSRDKPVGVVAVTSPASGDGKSTVATLLAGALVRVGASVLIIDADMRRPRLAAMLPVDDEHIGLSEVLEGRNSLDDAVQEGGMPGLSVVITSRRDDAGDLIARKMSEVLDQARETYDVVVVDCPPVLATDDARTLSLLCDGTLLVVSAGSDAAPVGEAAASLDSLGVRVLGTVLNRARLKRDGMGSYGSYRQMA